MKLQKPFKGVPNGKIFPIQYKAGDECPPELEDGARALGALPAKKTAAAGGKTGGKSGGKSAGSKKAETPSESETVSQTEGEGAGDTSDTETPETEADDTAEAKQSEPPADLVG